VPSAGHLAVKIWIGEQERAREVVGKVDLDELPGLGVLAAVPFEDRLVEFFLVKEAERDRVCKLKLQPLLKQVARDGEDPLVGIPRANDRAIGAFGHSEYAHADLI